jgi:AbrB family looped-hinge helix DNA binding protein
MRIPIDAVGRVVIPKPLREELGISGPTEVEVRTIDGGLELTVPDVPARVELRDGVPVIVTDRPMKPLTVESARAAIDRSRR